MKTRFKIYDLRLKSILRAIFLCLILNFAFLTFSLSNAYAQTIDPNLWQAGATGLKTSANVDKKTAGLVTTIQASGIPFLSLQGGMTNLGWGKLYSPPKGIDLGEIKIPGSTPALISESADWAHNEMAFSNNLKLWVSRLSQAILIQNLNNSFRLFSGNLNGATANGTTIVNRTASPAYPKYVAFQSGGTVRIQQIPASGATALNLPALDNNWVLVWFGNNSYFADTTKPSSYYDSNNLGILPYSDAYQADAPVLLKFQNNPTSIRQTTEGGIDLNFGGNSGYTSMMPLFGREHLQASDTEGWGTSGTLPANVLNKINFWNTNNRLCSYPTNVSETYAYDTNSDTSTITENITYLNVCPGGSTTSGFAILPPSLALAKDALKANITGTQVDAGYPTEFGPIIGIDNTNTYSWSVSGLRKYTDSKRVITNPNAAPTDLIQKLTSEIDKIVQDGHYMPWIDPAHLPNVDYTMGNIYYLNPADIVYQLTEVTQVLPDSSDPQAPKNRLIDYITSERTNYQPETVYNLPNVGTQRTAHAIRNLEPSTVDGGRNNFQSWQSRNPHLFLKRVPLYNFYALSKYYDLPTSGSVPSEVIDEAKKALNNDISEQDWATFSWFRGFNTGVWTGHATLVDVNRLLDGLVGFVKLSKAVADPEEYLGRALLTKAAVQRVAMAKYPRYLDSSGLQTLPSDPDWMPKYNAGQWPGYIWNYNWTTPYDDLRQIAFQDQFGTALSDSTAFYPPSPLLEIRDYEYLVNAQLTAYNDMVPETLRLLTDYAKQDFEIYLNKVTRLMPHWFMPYIEDFLGGEHGTTYPINSYQLFMAKAFVQNESPENLRKYTSFPWLDSGDLFYMQKLAETIKAYQGWAWSDTLTAGPCTISSLSWDTSNAVVGDLVDLRVFATGNCSQSTLTFEVDQNGFLGGKMTDPNPQTSSFTNNQASSTWTAEYTPKALGDPEYYFKASLDNGTTWSNNSSFLTVSQTPVPIPTPVVTPTPLSTPTSTPSPSPSSTPTPSGSPTPAPSGIPAGLVGYWNMDETAWNGTLGEVKDSSGNSNNGTSLCTGTGCTVSTTATGNFVRAGSFNGTNQYLNVVNNSSLRNQTFTIAAWVRVTGTGTKTIIGWGSTAGPQFRITGVNNLELLAQNSLSFGRSTATVPVNSWTHVAVTYDASGNYRFYINGADAGGSGSNQRTFTFSDMHIGTQTTGVFEYFNGLMDEVKIYNRALAASEITDLYNFNPLATPTPTPTPTPDTQAPSAPTNLASASATLSQVRLTWNASTDNVGVTQYWIVRNGVSIGSVNSTTTTYTDNTVLPSTTYAYSVLASDLAGNSSQPSNTLNVTTPAAPDTQAPTVPANLLAAAASDTQINLSWDASTDNVGVAGYSIYRNGTQIAQVSTTSFGDSGLTASTTYNYYVIAYDAANNRSTQSAAASATTQAPVTDGALNGVIYSSSTNQPLSGAKISLYINRQIISYYTNSQGNYTVSNVPAGSYSVKYTASRYSTKTMNISVTAGYATVVNVVLRQK